MHKQNFFVSAFPLFVVLFLDGMGLGLVFPLLNGIILDPQHSFLSPDTSVQMRNWLFGFIVGLFMICWFFGAPVLGDLSDKIGRKKSLLICLVGAFLGYFFAALGVVLKSISVILLGRIIAGFTSGSQSIAQAAIVDLSSVATKSRNIGYILLALSLGFVVGPMLGGVLSDPKIIPGTTYAVPFYFVAFVSLLNAALLVMLFKETHEKKGAISIQFGHAMSIFISAFKSVRIRYLSLCFLAFILGWSCYYTYISPFLFKKFGMSQIEVTSFMSLLGVGFAIGFAFLPSFCAKRFTLKASAIVSIFIAALCALLTFLFSTSLLAWITIVPMGCCVALAYANVVSIFSNQVEQEAQGWIMGITGAIMALSFGVTGLFSGLIQQEGVNTPIILSFIFLTATGLMLSFEKEGKPLHGPHD